MTFINQANAISKHENTGIAITLGSAISPFISAYGAFSFGSSSNVHSTNATAVHINAILTNDTDTNQPLGTISLTGSRIGPALAHKASVVMLPRSCITTTQSHVSMTSAVFDTGDQVLANQVDIYLFSCRGAS